MQRDHKLNKGENNIKNSVPPALDNLKKHLRFYKCINLSCVIGDACHVDLNINHEAHEVHEVLLNDFKNKII